MKTSIIPSDAPMLESTKPRQIDALARRLIFSILHGLSRGRLSVVEGGRQRSFGERTVDFPLEATVTVYHPRFFRMALFGGSVGAGEAYMAGYWSADDLTTVIRIMLLNRDVLQGMESRWAKLTAPLYRAFHFMRRGTREAARENIAAHYDLGNDFYKLFLDETMTYSCGIFEREGSTLEEASLAKYDRICRKLNLRDSDHLLEIGTGWGGFAIYAAANYGCRVTSTTISEAQFEFAKTRIDEARLADKVKVIMEDYRDLNGTYDKLVSIEMIEAVGHQYLDSFFQSCSQCLKEEGMMMLQAITIADNVFESHKRSVDFIKRYIFPGSCIPSVTAIGNSIARVSDLRMDHLEDITPHYTRTLRTWRERFFKNIEKVKALGFPDSFIRMWAYYLCYCEAGFQERYLGDVQIRLIKPLCRPEPILPNLH